MARTTFEQTTQMPEWVQEGARGLFNRAEQLSREGYTTFPGQRVAELTDDERRAQELMRERVGMGIGTLDETGDLLRSLAEPVDQAQIEQYMDPYHELVTENLLDELRRERDIAQQGVRDRAVGAGAFGGSRMGLREAETDRHFADAASRAIAEQGSRAYSQALEQALQDREAGFRTASGIASLAGQERAFAADDIQGLMGVGAMDRDLDQRGMDLAFEDFTRQQQFPYSQIGFASDILGGVPMGQEVYGFQQQPQPSSAQRWAGLGIAGLGALGSIPGAGGEGSLLGDAVGGIGSFIGGLF
jgi:hypothetical protein